MSIRINDLTFRKTKQFTLEAMQRTRLGWRVKSKLIKIGFGLFIIIPQFKLIPKPFH